MVSAEGSAAENAARFCRQHRTVFATNFLIAGPRAPAGVLEYDQDLQEERGVTLRLPPAGQDWIVTTNHFRARKAPIQCPRYQALAEALQGDTKLETLQDGWRMISRGSVDGTLHTLVYIPSERKILLSFATATRAAHRIRPVEFDLDELFKNAAQPARRPR
jgi:hypothetical protein